MYRILASGPLGVFDHCGFDCLADALAQLYLYKTREWAVARVLARNPNIHVYTFTIG